MHPEQKFIEDFGLYMEELGLTRMAGRILAWLLICEPPHQDMQQLEEALQASKSSISTTTRQLIQFGMLERVSLPGERRDYYRVTDSLWTQGLQRATHQFQSFRQLADQGLAILAAAPLVQRGRLQEMRDAYAFLEREYPALLEKWKTERHSQQSSE